ncbi:aldo/keto reductase [Mesobacillus foraminis]|uniref:aldo/keto reductase n=1 Tax=Mesobacillus foraminis TaxID=279826 RepID=UPI001BE7E019|nr:aldo/keto reductase [Mesobacillus foraminis]MBT2756772.1 aldo/keto reductase [Mesobacillus foraminis]
MERRKYGSTDLEVSVLGFGGAEIGGLGTPDVHSGGLELKEVEKLLGSALDAGLNVIDTAECYRDSEEKIGAAVSHRRDEYYLFTKCGHNPGFDLPNWDPAMLEMSIDRSLRRLRTDYLDVVHLHSCSEEVLRSGKVIEVLQRAKEKGKVRYIGYSGDHKDAEYAVKCGAFDSLMTSINIADQEAIDLTIPEARERGMGVTIKRPVANAVWRFDAMPDQTYYHDYWERLKQLNYRFLHGSGSEIAGTALRFALSVPGVHTAIVGTANPERWSENATLLEEGNLPPEQYETIRARWKEVAPSDWVGLE